MVSFPLSKIDTFYNVGYSPFQKFNAEVRLAKTKVRLIDHYNPYYAEKIRRGMVVIKPDATVVKATTLATSGKGLDIGCGLGRHSFHMAQNGFHVRAFDLSHVATTCVSTRAAQEGVSIEVSRGNILQQRLEREYDLIVCCWVLDEFDKHNAYWLLQRMREATLPGGYHAVVTTARGTVKGNMRARTGHHFFTEEELGALYTREGWRIIESKTLRESLSGEEVFAIRMIVQNLPPVL